VPSSRKAERLGQPDSDILKKRLYQNRIPDSGPVEYEMKSNSHRGLETKY